MLPEEVIVTAALPYANGRLHVGHIAGAYLPSDIYVRYLRMKGTAVKYICGSDDYGVAMVLAASREGVEPRAVAQKYHDLQEADFAALSISFDIYSSTSGNPHHSKVSQSFFLSLFKKGYFSKQKTNQYFDAERNTFLPDRFVRGTCGFCASPDQNGDQCEQCGRELDPTSLRDVTSLLSGSPVALRETTHWFLDLSLMQTQVELWLGTAKLREHTHAYVRSLLEQGLRPRSMTRDLAWGIPVPLDDPDAKDKVLYVWFDAPIGYITNALELSQMLTGTIDEGRRLWSAPDTKIFHFIGEDNTIFHSIIWIAMLSAESSFTLPTGVIVNHFLNFAGSRSDELGEKMSKSRGTAIWVNDLIVDGVPSDSIRYYLNAVAPEVSRTTFRLEDLYARHNNELAATVGNLFQRVIQFSLSRFGAAVPLLDHDSVATPAQLELVAGLRTCHAEVTAHLESFEFRQAQERVMEFARMMNKYLVDEAPWKSIKVDPAKARASIYYAFCGLKGLGIMLSPFLPETAKKIQKMLNLQPDDVNWNAAISEIAGGHPLAEPEILFPRLELAK